MSSGRRVVGAGIGVALIALPMVGAVTDEAVAGEGGPSATIAMGAWQTRALTGGRLAGKTQRTRDARFDVGSVPYTIRYVAAVDETDPTRAIPVEGYIGMPGPSSENWYHSGFLSIGLNGQDVGEAALSSMVVAESGERAILDLVWHHPVASVRVRFAGLAQDPALYAEIAIEPKQEITRVDVRARCYPSFFTAWHKRTGARRVKTPAALVAEGEARTVSAAEDWWMLYYDEVFDVAKGEGVGPCAMLVAPETPAEVSLRPGGYAVETAVTYPAATRRIRLAFWDLSGRSNAEVQAAMPQEAERARRVLAESDFTPKAIRQFDMMAAREAVRGALGSEAVRQQLGDRAEAMQAWLREAGTGPAEQQGAPDVAATEVLLRLIEEYNAFRWEMKLAELLAF